ncbi:glycosyl transferase family group 2-domain-containing protein [Protomyces lactucae-debilis]|uniref:Glycosyl transferase family group 2-domain-containing protein n=1 Tax=Protomyces lactucae-debilis TaxID=2754530 RepID=A0A1Y2FAR3_PROLT|nr:glycosyl transferase family group 2-domain-containing protein [Protomyces lactucae-debilis]ORY80973.1 glycosyl transferase family group 2-domain-containing protein [Protomyces lactucae-debilis]
MLQFVYSACDENEWFETWPGRSSLVAVRSHLDYACFPEPEGDNFLYTEVAKVLQPEVVMMMCSGLVEEFLANVPSFIDDVKLSDDLHIQIVDEVANLRYIRRHQYACFVRERHCLFLWADDARKLIPFASTVEELLVNRMWRTKDEKDSWRKEPVEIDRENANLDGARPVQLLLPFMVTCAVLINFLVLMLATRNIVKISIETKTYYRFLFLLYTPLQFVFTGFFTLMLVVAVLNCVGPIGHMFENSRHYSCKPPIRMKDNLPHVTIQCPVYKEDLADVIIPTVESLKIAISTYEKQGGSASIFINDDGMQLISEEERRVRRAFYEQNEIGWVARPGHGVGGFVRAGRFKKASNMNFSMNVSLRVEEKLELVERGADWTDDEETVVYKKALEEVLADIKATTGHQGWAGGNIRMGELILIVDSDTRVPQDCFLDAVSEFHNAPQVAILQHDCGVMQVSWDFWENAITYFTRCIYFSLQYATAAGDTAAFVGHNAFLRWSALQQVAYWDDVDGRQKWWSEEHVSEDFEMSLKLQGLGYISRYATYSNKGFQEGVSLTVFDELARWSKYAYGCSELVFNPFKDWIRHGPFTTIFKTFLKSDLNSYSKVTMIFYIGTYYAIALWPLLIVNLFAVGWGTWKLEKGWGFYNEGFGIFISVLIVFNIISPITNALVRYRARGGKFFEMLYDNFKWSFLLIVFLGGLSMHLSHALVAHMCSMKMEWGATAKSLEAGDFKSELPKIWKAFKGIYFVMAILAALQIVLAVVVPVKYRILSITANGPLIFLMLMHSIMPLILSPNSYASEWHADAKATVHDMSTWFTMQVNSVKAKLVDLNLISLGERDQYRRL